MKKSIICILVILAFLLIALSPSLSDAQTFTATLNEVDGSTLEARTPLILIHGIRGKENEGASAYWLNFISYYNQTYYFPNKYKLYLFEYDSDILSIDDIGVHLDNHIRSRSEFYYDNNTKSEDIVILAHSMGGLVARSYIQNLSISDYNRQVWLVTLATPHHGTPALNHDSKYDLASNANNRDLLYLPLWGLSNTWSTVFSVGSAKYWYDPPWDYITINEPNRSDMLWDNFDNVMDSNNNDINTWLQGLNSDTTFDNKIIAYYGYINPNSAEYQDNVNSIYIWGPTVKLGTLALSDKYLAGSIGMNYGLFKQDKSPDGEMGPYYMNDGIVPVQSASFEEHNYVTRVACPDYNHSEMHDGSTMKLCDNGKNLFDSVSDDLFNIVPGIKTPLYSMHVIRDIVFDHYGQFPAGTTFDFNINDSDAIKKSGNTFAFKRSDNYTVTMTVTYPNNDIETYSRIIFIKKAEIDVSYPDGYEEFSRDFSTPDYSCSVHSSPCIEQYSWNYNDGSPPENNRLGDHTYTTGGYYTVTLTLTLDAGPPIQSERGIFVGPGTRYIQGHTIYGDETWYSGGTYVVQGSIAVAQGGSLTIEPGVRVEMSGGKQIYVNGTLNSDGALFTWADGINEWRGIHFYGAGASESRLENSTIEHTSGVYFGCNYFYGQVGAIVIEGASPMITGSIINESSVGKGIWMKNASPTINSNTISGFTAAGIATDYSWCYTSSSSPIVTGNTISNNNYGISIDRNSSGIYQDNIITDNTQSGIYTSGSGMYQNNTFSNNNFGISVYYSTNNPVISSNIYVNNPSGDIYVSGTINEDVNWDETSNTTYRVNHLNIAEGASLTIASGKRVEFNSQLTVNGTLNSTGVTFTWADGVNEWRGIYFYGAGASESRLENSVIEHARGVPIGEYYYGAITMTTNSSPTITGNTINNSSANSGIWMDRSSPEISNNTISGFASSGIYTSSYSSPTVTGNTITNNNYGIFIYHYGSGIYQGNTISGNASAGLSSYTGNNVIEATNNDWGDPSGPYDPTDDTASGGLYNPNGLGDRVNGNVNYLPWLGMIDADGDGYPVGMDCDDNNPVINPDTRWYQDNDGDGFGNPVVAYVQCIQPTGPPNYVLDNNDYDDNDSNIGPPAMIDRILSYYLTLQEAYNAASDGDIIKCVDVMFTEDLTINIDKSVTIEGGYDGAYASNTGTTTLQGDIDISSGTLTIENFILQQ